MQKQDSPDDHKEASLADVADVVTFCRKAKSEHRTANRDSANAGTNKLKADG